MKLKIILLFLLGTIIISGCAPIKEGNNQSTSQQNTVDIHSNAGAKVLTEQQSKIKERSFNMSEYEGKWISSDYQIIQMDGYKASFGSELYLKLKADKTIEMRMYDISAPPANRIASIEKDIKISAEGTGSFIFENDGWGSHGTGTIELQDNQVIIIIDSKIEEGKYADWRVYSGKRVFVREKTPSKEV